MKSVSNDEILEVYKKLNLNNEEKRENFFKNDGYRLQTNLKESKIIFTNRT